MEQQIQTEKQVLRSRKGPEEQKFSKVALRLHGWPVPSRDRAQRLPGMVCGSDTTLRVPARAAACPPHGTTVTNERVSQEAGESGCIRF